MVRHSTVIVCAGLALVAARGSAAADRNADFMAALQDRGWDDVAVEYLAWINDSPLQTVEFSRQMPFYRARALAAQAGASRQSEERQSLQADAAAQFETYAKAHADAPEGARALREAANLRAAQALAIVDEIAKLPAQANVQRESLQQLAQRRF
ncbi:MAG: hypothetical protein KDA61_00955, partial [Planctomycetales bacterium]|nr:hypothetical protein [Planctomycetales bacterium]